MITRIHSAVLCLLVGCLIGAGPASGQQQAASAKPPADPYLWLEEQNGARAMAWVRDENAKTAAVLEKDPRFARLYSAALAIAQSNDRLPYAEFIGGQLYN